MSEMRISEHLLVFYNAKRVQFEKHEERVLAIFLEKMKN